MASQVQKKQNEVVLHAAGNRPADSFSSAFWMQLVYRGLKGNCISISGRNLL